MHSSISITVFILDGTTGNLNVNGAIYKDGVEVGRTYHRHVRAPGDNVSSDCAELQAVATALWTSDVIAAYEASL